MRELTKLNLIPLMPLQNRYSI